MAQADNEKVYPRFSEELLERMEEELQPEMGTSKSQVVRSITMSWLSEHGYFDSPRGDNEF